jgi:3alpha(or 20beta)-hydroxysteroid dehydrogenase
MTGRLAGKTALVTGGLGGIGWAIAELFVDEGASVVLADVRDDAAERVESELGGSARYQPLDVRVADQWHAVVEAVLRHYGELHVLVNNAGVWRNSSLFDVSEDDVRACFEVNQLGCVLGMQAVAEPIRASGGGAIVNVASGAGLGGYPNQIAYGATKWAVRGMTRTAAMELGELGIRVNAVCPGSVDTLMTAAVQRPSGNPFGFLPVSRRGMPEEVAQAVLHLAGDESAYTTGAEVVVDGGLNAGPVMPKPTV